ncbi:DgyrCDS4571 [Dimorphilus gyrociliatus]|uniref:DgyrCDS4571 n=1 Tax=Dimorphilus gyrociliatus TaxID=2664684 RepID=A0A7I8VIT9_9ANNE|nr:DgyrCDS4571 [Dimorphilus gyrociliatus]
MDRSSYQSAAEATKIYYYKYVRNARVVGVIWALFVICLAIIEVVVFAQPQWLGDSKSSPGTGYFGLFKYCILLEDTSGELKCFGGLDNFSSILNGNFKAATVLVGISVLIIFFCVISLLLFFFVSPKRVYYSIAMLLILAAIFLAIGCLVYPNGWDDKDVRRVCGKDSDKFDRADCEIRWALILAVIAIFDGIVLALLAIVLGSRQVPRRSRVLLKNETIPVVAKSDYAESIGKPSVLIQPRIATASDDHFADYSQYSSRARSRKGF